MDPLTIVTIGERLLHISISAFLSFRQAAKDAGAGTAVLEELDAKYEVRIARERSILSGNG